jgi:hypothetical protein
VKAVVLDAPYSWAATLESVCRSALNNCLLVRFCRDLGVKAVVLDAPDSWAQLLEGEGVIAKFMPVDFSDAEHVFEHCLRVSTAKDISCGAVQCCCSSYAKCVSVDFLMPGVSLNTA